jgi:hypothetical protein
MMPAKQRHCACALTLIEVMVSVTILCVGTLGALSYQYQAARQSWLANAQTIAVRTGYLILEDWKANGGSKVYVTGSSGAHNPAKLGLGFVYVGTGVYKVTVDELPMYVELSRPSENLALIPLTVIVRYPAYDDISTVRSNRPSIVLSTYARADQTSG